MKEGQPREIRLEEYRAPGYTTRETELVFDIHDGETTVTNTMRLERLDADADSVTLDGQDLELVSVRLDGRELSANEYALDEESLTLHGLGAGAEVEIVTRIKPEENTALEGLYRSSHMYCTQCEAEGFRKITYYQDRPDVLARFRTTVIADAAAYPTLLSNGNLVAESEPKAGRHSATWEDPFPKPSYLFALVAGDLEVITDSFTTMSGREIELRIYSEAHNIDQCHYAMGVLKRSMSWDEERFGREYDLDIFMIVAVEDFNMGAMENKGLNIFNTACVLASPDTATDAAYQRVEAVVAHEYFHNWSGNRVTCRDWFQLSLKEGFTVFRDAEFSSDMNSRPVKRIEDVTFLRSVQFAEDGGPLAHPVRPQSYIEISNFYTTTIYEKGAEVVRMYHTLLGEDKFRAATDLYFDRFDGSAATTDDFAASMAEVGQLDLTQFKRWYEQAGTPLLSVRDHYVDDTYTVEIEQTCPATPGQPDKLPFHMPVALGLLAEDDNGVQSVDVGDALAASTEQWESRDSGATALVQLRNAKATLSFNGLTSKPVLSFLRGFSAPVRVHHARPDAELGFLARHDVDGFVRWDALQTLWVKHFGASAQIEGVDLEQLVGDVAREALNLGDNAEAKLLAATMLTVPDENYLFEQLETFEVMAVVNAREAMLDGLGKAHVQTWQALYERYGQEGAYQPDAVGMANRALANIGFAGLARALDGDDLADLVRTHYERADNLTDRRAALAVASRHERLAEDVRQALFADFFEKWQHEALVLDLWFSLQAQSPLTDVAGIEALTRHDRFDLKNPNRARSVLAVFGMFNHRTFHKPDGSGYDYLAGAVAEVDKLNPQMAARLATPLTRWQRYDPARQERMRQSLTQLADASALSKDLFEIVTKSLA